jgi:hypothetical protein
MSRINKSYSLAISILYFFAAVGRCREIGVGVYEGEIPGVFFAHRITFPQRTPFNHRDVRYVADNPSIVTSISSGFFYFFCHHAFPPFILHIPFGTAIPNRAPLPGTLFPVIVIPVIARISRERNNPCPVFLPKPRMKSFFLSSAEIPARSSSQRIVSYASYVRVWDMYPDFEIFFSPPAHPVYLVGSSLFTDTIQVNSSCCSDFFVQHIPLMGSGGEGILFL